MNHRRSLGLNQSGHAGQTELMLIVLLVGVGAAFFIPRMHSGILNALGKTFLDVFLFLVGLILLLIVIDGLRKFKDFFVNQLLKFLKEKDPPKPPGAP